MKLRLFAITLSLAASFSVSAFAATGSTSTAVELNPAQLENLETQYLQQGYFPVQAYTFVTPFQVMVQVYNNYARPLLCNGWVQGTTATGFPMQAYFNMAPMYPGQMGYAYVQAPYNAPFVSAWATAYCSPL
ncbi:MAG: hypothetical protein H7222_12090 [Methylotenera sp.]|nr:hypothetical protein [Oligoflexia bacterium]